MADVAKATPRPWVVKPAEVGVPYIRIRGTVLGCRYKIANLLYLITGGVLDRADREEAEANAALIVEAVNTHEAHQAVAEAARSIENDDGSIPETLWVALRAALARLDAIEGGGA